MSHHSREINCFLITITEHLIYSNPSTTFAYGSIEEPCTIGKVQAHVLARRESDNISILATCLELANVREPDHNFERLGVSSFKYLSSCSN